MGKNILLLVLFITNGITLSLWWNTASKPAPAQTHHSVLEEELSALKEQNAVLKNTVRSLRENQNQAITENIPAAPVPPPAPVAPAAPEETPEMVARNDEASKVISSLADLLSLSSSASNGVIQLEAGDPQLSAFTDNLMDTFYRQQSNRQIDQRLKDLTRRLQLSPEQADQARALLARKEQERIGALQALMKGAGHAENLAAQLSAPASAEPEFIALLSPDQQQAYAEYAESTRANYRESTARAQLARLQKTVPDLSEEQKQAAFDAYFAQSENEAFDPLGMSGGGGMINLAAPAPQDDPIKALLTPDQQEKYKEARPGFDLNGGAGGAFFIAPQVIELGVP